MSHPSQPSPTALLAFNRFVARRGEGVAVRLFELADDACPVGKESALLRQLVLTPLWVNLRDLSDLAMDNIQSCLRRGLPFQVYMRCNPKARAAGEQTDVFCYPGEGWIFNIWHATEEGHALVTPPQGSPEKSSREPLRSPGVRH